MSEETLQMLFSYAPIILVGLVFYFMLYRPQKKQEKTRHEMLDNLKKGDRVKVFELGPHKGSALSWFYVLKVNDLPSAAVNFHCCASTKIIS